MSCSSGNRATRARLVLLAMLAIAGLATAATAATPTILPSVPSCVPRAGNIPVVVMVKPETGWSSVRVYFRRAGNPEWYFLELRAESKGLFWAVLPKPDSGDKAIEYQIVVRDADGKETRAPAERIPVTAECKVPLTLDQSKYAQNLVIGETFADQENARVLGFLCDGIVSRIDLKGVLKPDNECRKVVMAAAAGGHSVLLPLALIGGAGGGIAIIRHHEKQEASPVRP